MEVLSSALLFRMAEISEVTFEIQTTQCLLKVSILFTSLSKIPGLECYLPFAYMALLFFLSDFLYNQRKLINNPQNTWALIIYPKYQVEILAWSCSWDNLKSFDSCMHTLMHLYIPVRMCSSESWGSALVESTFPPLSHLTGHCCPVKFMLQLVSVPQPWLNSGW